MMLRHVSTSSRRTTTSMIGALLAVLATATAAFAYWSTRGTGTASASSGTLNAATAVTASSPALATVNVSWTPPSSPGAGGTLAYYVQRTNGTTTSSACGTSATTTITTSSCTDSNIPGGTYTYKVVTVFNSWTATSAASNAVAVTAADTTAPSPTVNQVGTTGATSTTLPTLSGTAGTQKADATHSADITTVTVDFYPGTATSGNKVQGFTNVAVNATTGAWSVTLTSALTANAQSTVVVSQLDAAGNKGTATRTFLVDTAPPTVSAPTVNGRS